jgi:hypothetical protein
MPDGSTGQGVAAVAGGKVPAEQIPVVSGIDAASFRAEIVPRYRPVVLKDLVRDWPAVQAAQRSAADAFDYVARFDRGAVVEAFVGPPAIEGRYFYRPDMSGFNFEKKRGQLSDVLGYMLRAAEAPDAPTVYVGSVPTPEVVPGFAEANELGVLDPRLAVQRIWIGNRSIVSTHFDVSDNIACVVAGRRRFTLFPPDQVGNLYVGPLDFTMAGQPASMVSLREPDLGRFPRFREALAAAQVAELEPGDAIYIPELWWHNVEALEPLNILINYWWRDVPREAGSPFEALAHGLLTVAPLRPPLRAAWAALFDHYVFRPDGDPAEHLPPQHRGILGAPTPQLRARFKQFLLAMIGRY